MDITDGLAAIQAVDEHVAHLTRLVEDVADQVLRTLLHLRGDNRREAVLAAGVLKDMRPALASVTADAGILAAALALNRRETAVRSFRQGWEARDAQPGGTAGGRQLRAI